ncbi:selenophosphate synthase [Marinitoga sp. 1197]|uniref:AIR synthase related protein n=1 Tax=Marinitoga sp. 1197 TaxID=1428449 RepID=UPI000640BA74|nr:AIR synthase related protein [Marinitoga sp. 1197]KLO22962.1 selenophosphate synthase [Marinitoga sp. 1197]
MKIKKFRDLSIIELDKKKEIVIACDSSGAIGNKEKDIVKVPPEIVGYFGAHVALSEIIAYGAYPIAIVNTLSVEMNNTGKKILEGIKKAVKPLKLDMDKIITGSTEENFPVIQTGMGITVIGIKKRNINFLTVSGDIALVIGIPKVGEEVVGSKDILTISELLKLRNLNFIHEILPVGSKGLLYEANEIAKTENLNFILSKNIVLDVYKSAGPATCAIVTLKRNDYEKIKEIIDIPVNLIGEYI